MQHNALLSRIEERQLWEHFHKDFLIEVRTLLRQQLPREYHVFVESTALVIAPPLGERIASTGPDIAVGRSEASVPRPRAQDRVVHATMVVEEDFQIYTAYTLVVRRAPDNRVVAACEMLSPTNKGVSGKPDQEKYLRKRERYIDMGINLLEIDALLKGERILPPSLAKIARFARNAWTLLHRSAQRVWRGWGWDPHEALPTVDWEVEEGVLTSLSLGQALERAIEFNQWEDLAR
jgi:hypothetical protein